MVKVILYMNDIEKKNRYIDELVEAIRNNGYDIPDEIIDSTKNKYLSNDLSYDEFKIRINSSTKRLP